MKLRILMPRLALGLSACSTTKNAPAAPEPRVTHYVMHSPSSSDLHSDCFDITETVRAVAFAGENGNVIYMPELTNKYFPTPCTPDALPYSPRWI